METEILEKKISNIEELENRLAEAEQLIEAIKRGEVDAFAVMNDSKSEVFTIESGDYPYRILVENFNEGAITVTEDGLIVYSNKYFHELMHSPYEKVVGNAIQNYIADESKDSFQHLLVRAQSGNSNGEINLISDGLIIPVYISLTSLAPHLPAIGIIVTDLSDKKKNERSLLLKNEALIRMNTELREAKTFINNVLTSTNHGVISLHSIRKYNLIADFEIRYANKMALDLLLLNDTDPIGKSFLDHMPPAKSNGLFDRMKNVVENRKSESFEFHLANSERWSIVHFVPLEDGVTCTFVEITDQKKQAQALETKNIELELTNSELTSFSYIASHDLQEPLRKIQTFSSRIMEKEVDSLSDTGQDYFRRIINATKHMQNLIEALLSYSRTNLNDQVFVSTELNSVLEEVKNNHREILSECGAEINISSLPMLQIIPLQFNQLFSNIIMNAVKYRDKNRKLQLQISSELVSEGEAGTNVPVLKNKYWKIKIEDNGIGFEPQFANKIFGLFQRLHSREEYEGTGIGLAICKKIVQNHDGYIYAEGSPGTGATFYICIPHKNN